MPRCINDTIIHQMQTHREKKFSRWAFHLQEVLIYWMVNSRVYHCLSWYFRMREGISSGS